MPLITARPYFVVPVPFGQDFGFGTPIQDGSDYASPIIGTDPGYGLYATMHEALSADDNNAVVGSTVLSGLSYIEMYVIDPDPSANTIGMVPTTGFPVGTSKPGFVASPTPNAGMDETGGLSKNNGFVPGSPLLMDGDTILSMAYNATTGNLWLGEDGVWYNSGNPDTGTNPTFTGMSGPDLSYAFSIQESDSRMIVLGSDFYYTPPWSLGGKRVENPDGSWVAGWNFKNGHKNAFTYVENSVYSGTMTSTGTGTRHFRSNYVIPSFGYAEFLVNTLGGFSAIGVKPNDASNLSYPGAGNPGEQNIGYENGGDVRVNGSIATTYASYTAGDRIMVAWQRPNKIWFGKNGVWNGNPNAGTGQVPGSYTFHSATCIAAAMHTASDSMSVYTDSSGWVYSSPWP